MTPTGHLAELLHDNQMGCIHDHPGDPTCWRNHEGDAARLIAAGVALVPTPPDALFTEAEAPRSLTSYVDEWMAEYPQTAEIIEVNLRVFAVWADCRYRAALAPKEPTDG